MSMTSNDPSIVDSDAFTVRRTITIAAPIEKVWAAISEPEHVAKWFPQAVDLEPVAIGTEGTFTFDGYGVFPVRIEELDPPHTIAYRWGNNDAEPVPLDVDHSTVFRFALEEVETGTRLTVVETGFDTLSDPAAAMEGNRGGWDSELDKLVAYVEGVS